MSDFNTLHQSMRKALCLATERLHTVSNRLKTVCRLLHRIQEYEQDMSEARKLRQRLRKTLAGIREGFQTITEDYDQLVLQCAGDMSVVAYQIEERENELNRIGELLHAASNDIERLESFTWGCELICCEYPGAKPNPSMIRASFGILEKPADETASRLKEAPDK